MCMPPYSLLSDGFQNRHLSSLHSFLLQKSLHCGVPQLPSSPLELKRYFRPHGEEVFDWVISSDLLPLNDPDTPTLLHRSSGSRSSPDISFASSSLAIACSWEMLQDLGSDHLPILLSIPLSLSPVYRPNERPFPSTFRNLAGMALLLTLTLTVLLQRNTRLFLFPLLLVSLSLWHWMRPNLPFLSAASNALLKPGDLLR